MENYLNESTMENQIMIENDLKENHSIESIYFSKEN